MITEALLFFLFCGSVRSSPCYYASISRRTRFAYISLKRFCRSHLIALRIVSCGMTAGWMGVIFWVLADPAPPSPTVPAWWFPILAHIGLFGILGTSGAFSTAALTPRASWNRQLLTVVLLVFTWGIFTELYQLTIPSRSASWEDVVWDLCGGIAGAAGLLGFRAFADDVLTAE